MKLVPIAAAFALAAWAAPAAAATVRFDTADSKSPAAASLLEAVRGASLQEVPAIGAVKVDPAYWGRDGRWCEDGQVYHGGPCDRSTWGGGYPPQPPYPQPPYPQPPYPQPPYPQPPYPGGGGDGYDAAMGVCRAMFTDSDKLACMRVVRSARRFDLPAVRLCRDLFTDRDKVACLETIADAYVAPEVVRVCRGLFSDAEKLRCMREQLGGPPPYPPGPHPGPLPPGGGHGVRLAYEACQEMFTDRSKMECLSAVRPARFFDEEAVGLCRVLFTDASKIECLRTIMDRSYRRGMVSICGDMFTDRDKIRCLREN